MHILERINDSHEALRAALDSRQAKMWTALPGVINSYNSATMTCEVKPSIMARITKVISNTRPPKTSTSLVEFPLLLDCPVVFPQGGGARLTFPLQPGDECLVIFSSRGIDHWWQNGGVQAPAEARMHDLSDGFVIPGPTSQPRTPSNTPVAWLSSPDLVELRSTDGVHGLSFNPKSGAVTITGSLNVQGSSLISSGASGSFTTVTGQTVTVQNGLITNLS